MEQVIHRLVAKNGKYIVMPSWCAGQVGWGNLAHPDIYLATSVPKYPLGTMFVDGDRVFFYGYVHTVEGTATKCGQGLFNIDVGKVATLDAASEPIGEDEIKIEDTASVVNQWAGGYLMSRTHPTLTYRILSNTVQDGEHSVLKLERALIVALASGQTVRLYANKYSKLCSTVNAGRRDVSVMGITPLVPVASTYQWIQSWGDANVLGGDEVPGSGNSLRMCQFNIDGTLIWGGLPDASNGGQLAGYIINDSNAASYLASWFVYLMVAR